MVKVSDVYEFLNTLAPFDTQMQWDNAGFLVGDSSAEAKKIGLCLDITADTLDQAVDKGVDLVISHHPVIFTSTKTLTSGSLPYELVKSGISAICAHTNLDLASGGVNDRLAKDLGLEDIGILNDDDLPLGRIGKLQDALSVKQLAERVKAALCCGGVRFTDSRDKIRTVAVCGGAGADLLISAKRAGADALVTGECKHHELLLAHSIGIALIDGGHFSTEHNIVYTLLDKLSEQFLSLDIIVLDEKEPASYI